MYRPYAAAEDTVVFPAWEQTLSARESDEMAEPFSACMRTGCDGLVLFRLPGEHALTMVPI